MKRLLHNSLLFCTLVVGVLSAIGVSAQPKYVAKPTGGYGMCGNGVVERLPSLSGGGGQELCDGSQQMLDNLNKGGSVEKAETCYYAGSAGCQVRPSVYNNGVIERVNGVMEECDDGNEDPNDSCNAGALVGAITYPDPSKSTELCGNGVLDPGEVCDAGKERPEIDVCEDYATDRCQHFKNSSDPRSLDGYACDLPGHAEQLCGNKRVDPNTSEQCDNGRMNGKDGICTEVCTLEDRNPVFKRDLFYFFGEAKSGQLDKRALLNFGSKPLDPRKSDKYSIYDRGRVIRIDRDRGQQYSGIVPSSVPFDVTKRPLDISFAFKTADAYRFDNDWFGIVIGVSKDIDKDLPSNKYLMLAWRDTNNEGFNSSNDYSNVQPSRCKGQVHSDKRGLRLYWITGKPDYNELWQMEDCGTGGASRHITEIPTEYQPDDVKLGDANMISYNTKVFGEKKVQDALAALPGGKGKYWNNMVNAAYALSPFYYRDFVLFDAPREDNVIQISIKYSIDKMDVWVNHQKMISVNSSILGNDWPKRGEWGFYFLGMDDFIADFRSPEHRLLNQPNDWFKIKKVGDKIDYKLNPILNDPTGIRCGYCGDGVRQDVTGPGHSNEECDGGRLTVEGCRSDCRNDTGWMCDTNEDPLPGTYKGEPTVCYTGEFTVPDPNSKLTLFNSATPMFEGTYKGSPGVITMHVKKGGSDVCVADAAIDPSHKTWKFSTTSCGTSGLADGDDYSVSFDMKYNQRTVPTQVLTYPPAGKEIKFQIATQGPAVAFTSPVGKPSYLKQISSIQGTFNTESAITLSATKSWDPKSSTLHAFSDQPISSLTPSSSSASSGTWSASLGTIGVSTGTQDGVYTFKISAKNSSPIQGSAESIVVIDNRAPDSPSVVTSNDVVVIDGQALVADGGTVELQGVTSSYDDKEAPVSVTVELKNKRNNEVSRVTVGVDKTTGGYHLKLPVPADPQQADRYELTVTAQDKAGNETSVSFGKNAGEVGLTIIPNGPVINTLTLSPGNDGVAPFTFKETVSGKFAVDIAVGPQHPADKNDLKVAYCVGGSCTVPALSPCTSYDSTTGVCTLNITHSLTSGRATVRVKGEATVGHQKIAEKEQVYHIDNRDFSGPANRPTITLNPPADSSDKIVLNGQPLQITVQGGGVVEKGDTAYIFVNNHQKTCKLSSTKTCTVSIPADEVVGSTGKVEVSVSIQNDAGTSTEQVTKVYTPASYDISIVSPKSGNNSGWTNCTLDLELAGGVPGGQVELEFSNSGGPVTVSPAEITLDDRGSAKGKVHLIDSTTQSCYNGPFNVKVKMTVFDPITAAELASATKSVSGVDVSWNQVDPADVISITSPTAGSSNQLDGGALHVIVEGGRPNEGVLVVVTDSAGKEVFRQDATFNDSGVADVAVTGVNSSGSPYKVTATAAHFGRKIESVVDNVVVTTAPSVSHKLLISEPSAGGTSQLDQDGKLRVVIAEGKPNSSAKITVTGQDGKSKETTVTFDGTGNIATTVDLPENSTGPYRVTISATASDDSQVTESVNGVTVKEMVKTFTIVSPAKDGSTTLNENGKLPIVITGGKVGEKVRVEITDSEGKMKVVTGEIGTDGSFNEDVSLGGLNSGPYNVKVLVNGKEQSYKGVSVKPYDPAKAGKKKGCGCASTAPASDSFVSLLLLALGFGFLRRRKDEE